MCTKWKQCGCEILPLKQDSGEFCLIAFYIQFAQVLMNTQGTKQLKIISSPAYTWCVNYATFYFNVECSPKCAWKRKVTQILGFSSRGYVFEKKYFLYFLNAKKVFHYSLPIITSEIYLTSITRQNSITKAMPIWTVLQWCSCTDTGVLLQLIWWRHSLPTEELSCRHSTVYTTAYVAQGGGIFTPLSNISCYVDIV